MKNRFLKLNILIFFIILGLSLLFRVSNLDLIEFKTDEAVNLLLTARPAFNHPLPPGGTVSSIGILNPPLFNYLLTPLAFFTLDPKAFSFSIALLNSVAIVFFYLIVKKYYGEIIAFTSAILFALSPWSILYSRKIWTQDLLVPFFVLFFYSSHKIIKERKQIFWAPFILSSLFLIQLHQIVILFIALVLLFMFMEKVKFDFKFILIGLILGIIPLFPYIGYEAKNGYPDFKAVFSSQNKLASKRSPELFLRPLQITGQGYINFEVGSDLGVLIKKFPFMKEARIIFYFDYILIVLGAFISLKRFKSLKFLSLPAIALPFLYFLIKVDPFMHYYIIILPLLFLFIGIAFEFLLNQKNNLLKSASISLFLILTITSLYFDFSFFKLLKDQGHFQGDYGSSLSDSENHIKYKKYDEMFLSQFIPLDYYFGYNPFSKIIYEDSSENISTLENKLQTSNDPRIQNQLLALYTKDITSLKTLDVLRKKSREIPQYSAIYNVVLDDYLAKNYKKLYSSNKFDFSFFYPQHWKIKENGDIRIDGDYLTLIIQKGKINPNFEPAIKKNMIILREKAQKIECNKNNYNCGILYSFRSYSALMQPKNSNSEKEIGAVDELLNSLRFLSD